MAQPIKCRSAILHQEGRPLVIEETICPPPGPGQVRIKMVSAGVCATDVHYASGEQHLSDLQHEPPIILGHEGAGRIESVGEGIKDLAPGDPVLISCCPRCDECRGCQCPSSNFCYKYTFLMVGHHWVQEMANGSGKVHGLGKAGTFTEYATVDREQVVKITDKANLQHSAIIGCAVVTGFYSAVNLGKVHAGSTCAVWGIGAIGLNVIQGCRFNGAKHIIAIDINPEKRAKAIEFGATEFINSKELDRPIVQYLMEKYQGIDYGFDCYGHQTIIDQALQSLTPFGKCISIGIVSPESNIKYPPFKLLSGRSIIGGCLGGINPEKGLPELVQLYHEKKILIDELITHKFKLDEINEAFHMLSKGKAIRSLILFD